MSATHTPAAPPALQRRRRPAIERAIATALALAVSSGAPRASHAQRPAPADRAVRVTFAGATPRATFAYHDLFDADTLRRVRSGLQVTIVMRAWAVPAEGGEPIGFAVRSCRVAYEIWDENYSVEVLDPAGLRTIQLTTVQAVVGQCGEVRELPLRMSRPLRTGERFRVATVAEIDPLTPDMVARIQRWVARPGDATPEAPAGNFFGSFVALFVNPTVGEAERTLRFDSGPQVAP